MMESVDVTVQPQRPATWSRVARPVAEWLLPGIAQVRAQTVPFAQAWEAANAEALRAGGPLWVALGDSMSQGIGARSIDGGWVRQLQTRLRLAGSPLRMVNLSVTGARLHDVLARQVPQLAGFGDDVALVTVLAGANDMVRRDTRQHVPGAMAELLAALPPGRTVVATLPQRHVAALAANTVLEAAARRGTIRLVDLRGMSLRSLFGTLAADFFHPNERGYAYLADAFGRALPACFDGSQPASEIGRSRGRTGAKLPTPWPAPDT